MSKMEYTLLDTTAYPPLKAHESDAGFDIYSNEIRTIPGKESRLVRTGLCIHIPSGNVGLLYSRSGMAKRGIRLSNCVGVIDSGYLGEIGVMLFNDSTLDYIVNRGDKIAQLVITPITPIELQLVVKFSEETARGVNGFGSTGT